MITVGAMAQFKESRNHQGKHIYRKYHLIHEMVKRSKLVVKKVPSTDNLVDPFNKILTRRVFNHQKNSISVRCISCMLERHDALRISRKMLR